MLSWGPAPALLFCGRRRNAPRVGCGGGGGGRRPPACTHASVCWRPVHNLTTHASRVTSPQLKPSLSQPVQSFHSFLSSFSRTPLSPVCGCCGLPLLGCGQSLFDSFFSASFLPLWVGPNRRSASSFVSLPLNHQSHFSPPCVRRCACWRLPPQWLQQPPAAWTARPPACATTRAMPSTAFARMAARAL